MRRFTLAAAIVALTLGTAASASAQSYNCGQDNRAAGTVVGAIVGATAGGVIANNSKSYRGGRGYRGHRGFRSHRGYRGGRGYRSSRGNQEVGIIAGALIGGLIGNQVASSNVRNCQTVVGPNTYRGDPYATRQTGFSQTLAGGTIDHNAARLGDPYGGRQVVDGRYVNTTQPADPRGVTNNNAIDANRSNTGVFQPVCKTIERSTSYSGGDPFYEEVDVCQYSQGGEWIEQ